MQQEITLKFSGTAYKPEESTSETALTGLRSTDAPVGNVNDIKYIAEYVIFSTPLKI